MFKRILFSAGASAALLAAACSSGTEPDDGCTELFNTRASTSGDTVVTTTGLRYIEQTQGNGATVVSCRGVAIFYRGTLLDGKEFASRAPIAFTPGRNEVIDGFEQGVVGMRVGGSRRLIIPPSLGYGAIERRNQAGEIVIPANSTLIFDIEAQAVEP